MTVILRKHWIVASRWLLLFLFIVAAIMPSLHLEADDNSAPQSPVKADAVIGYLNQTIGWDRHLTVEQQLATEPSDILFFNDDRDLADQVVHYSFDFARAAAQQLSHPSTNAATATAQNARYQNLAQMADKADQTAKQTQQELDGLQQKLANARTAKDRKELQSAIAEVQSEIDLATTRRDVLRNMLEFVSGTAASGLGASGLRSQIEELARTVPSESARAVNATKPGTNSNAANGTTTASASAATAAAPAKAHSEPNGILALISSVISLSHKVHTLDNSLYQTNQLADTAKKLRAPQVALLKQLIQQGDQVTAQPDSTDPQVLGQQKQQLDSLTAEFKQISALVLPLSKQSVLLDLYIRSLTNWRDSVKNEYDTELRNLLIRIAILAVVLAAVFGASEIWRKAIYRYVPDARRRYQFMLMRRIAMWIVVTIVIAVAFATELGSLATFAGLITAGVAVALQNVILSVAGYFFLIGKYGVRVGDRVQVNNITGEVVDVGLVRLHLMELSGGGSDAQPTGRVVVFSNSVVFSGGSGLFKQIPGTNFVWHEITLTLAPDSNFRQVEDRLMKAVDKVYSSYGEEMERQRKRMQMNLGPVTTGELKPHSRLRLTQTGIEVVIRYPLELEHAAQVDDRITRELLDAIEREPRLKLVGTGTPNLQPVAVPEPAATR